ncbi:MAG: SAP domain-containing protein [Lachnospiraceae bacterium]|nr:SAP domain-containing protein [Lachnospiraceae bacterium]
MGLFDFFKKKAVEVKHEETKKLDNVKEETLKVIRESLEAEVTFSIEVAEPAPLEELLKEATPSKQGLYPHEIMMLEYATHFKTSNNNFQNFWYYQYSVTEPQKLLDSLYERGFIEVGDLRSALEKLKLPEIKEELKLLNQKVTGKKAELIDRLMETGDISGLNEKYPERYYVHTAKGELELKENQYVSYLHKNRYMTVWEMNKRIAEMHYPYRDILWGYFNEQSTVHFGNFDFGLYRNTRLDMYRFLTEENKPKTAFRLLCEVLAVDLSGLGNNEKHLYEYEIEDPEFYLSLYERRLERFLPYNESSMVIAPGIVGFFKEMQSILGLNDDEYKEAILYELKQVQLPRSIFTVDECADILIACLHNDESTLSAVYKGAEKRENARLQTIKAKLKK